MKIQIVLLTFLSNFLFFSYAQVPQNSLSVFVAGEFPQGDFANEDVFAGKGNAGNGFSLKSRLENRSLTSFGLGQVLAQWRRVFSEGETFTFRDNFLRLSPQFNASFYSLGIGYRFTFSNKNQ